MKRKQIEMAFMRCYRMLDCDIDGREEARQAYKDIYDTLNKKPGLSSPPSEGAGKEINQSAEAFRTMLDEDLDTGGLVWAMAEYIKFLSLDIERNVGFLHVHGIQTSAEDIEKGKVLRARIDALKSQPSPSPVSEEENAQPAQFGFLHRHPYREHKLNLDEGHVIVDKEDWLKARNSGARELEF